MGGGEGGAHVDTGPPMDRNSERTFPSYERTLTSGASLYYWPSSAALRLLSSVHIADIMYHRHGAHSDFEPIMWFFSSCLSSFDSHFVL